jgi:tellurite resistance protein TerC
MSGQTALWVIFGGLMLVMAVLDLGLLNRRTQETSLKSALLGSALWILLALAFNLGIYFWQGYEKALLFFTGYLVEESLSVDNLFVFLLIFSAFRVPKARQPKLLFWGITFAVGLRVLFIAAGVSLIHRFHWIIFIFGAFLIYTGAKLFRQKDEPKEFQPEKNAALKLLQRWIPVNSDYTTGRYWVRTAGRWSVTPLFLALLALPVADVVFAADSIPAILAITTDTFVVVTSNVFAVLGLRALFFALAGFMSMFQYLNLGLAVVLVFVGTKMLISDFYKMPALLALGVIMGVLGVSVMLSVVKPRKEKPRPETKVN